jgi:hypothetical protein
MTTGQSLSTHTRAFLMGRPVWGVLLASSEIWLCVSVSLCSSYSVRMVAESAGVLAFVRRIILSPRSQLLLCGRGQTVVRRTGRDIRPSAE